MQTTKTLSKPLPEEFVADGTTRFNDGGCDPKGRFFAGSMALPELEDGKKRGVVWRCVNDLVYLDCSTLVLMAFGLRSWPCGVGNALITELPAASTPTESRLR
jgi:hypothetical protein